ncbi:alcohol dehydrogenase catalytic domain-containing protein [Streptomyces phaeofaciens]|uniref:alcohol dehydrogenase catalytic domain-containing protein n=1 Tax=Streptomyces phaeofaciens TaxID=68254 RepID=UPI0035715C97
MRVHAAGANPVDTYNRETGVLVGEPPFVLGWDVCGTVEAVGAGVTLYELFGMLPLPHGHGAFAQYVLAPTRAFMPKPKNLGHVQAAALPLAGLTTWQALVETARIGKDSRVLINGTAGGVGHLALQIVLVTTLPHTLADVLPEAARRGVRAAGLFVEADRIGMRALADLAATGRLVPTVDATYPLEQAGAAQTAKSGRGKTVLTGA